MIATDFNYTRENRYLFFEEKRIYPFSILLSSRKNELSEAYQGILINMEAFRKYIRYKDKFALSDIQDKFLYLNWFDYGEYRAIRSTEDLIDLYKEFPLNTNWNYDHKISLESLLQRFDLLCWQEDDGLIGYNFIFESSNLIDIEPDLIHSLGIENTPSPSNAIILF